MRSINGLRRRSADGGLPNSGYVLPPLALALALTLVGAASPPAGAAGAPAGSQLWAARDAGPHGAYDQIGGMALSPDGSTVYVARRSNGALAVVARDALTGARRWAVLTEHPGGAQMFAEALAVSPDGGRLFVTASVEESVDTRTTRTIAYDTLHGSMLWAARLSVGVDRAVIPRRIAVSPDGCRLFITGSQTGSQGSDDHWDYFTVGYSTQTGIRLWRTGFNGSADGGDTAEGIGVSPDGTRVYVTGTSRDTPADDRDFVTIAYRAADGKREWAARYDPGVDDFATDLGVSPDGSAVYAAGFGRPSTSVPHYYQLVAYNPATGARLRSVRYSNLRDDMSTDLAVSDDSSRVLVTGGDGGDFLTVSFDASTFARQWSSRYDGGHGIDRAYAVTTSPDGTRVYVAGESEEGSIACFGDVRSTAFATVAYDAATGASAWVSRYTGNKDDPDQASELAVSPDGTSLFVSGDSDFECASSDVATVAYAAG